MRVVKRIVCLANSRKLSGRCVAGKEQTPAGFGSWIRPVSSRVGEEVSDEERRYEDGSDPCLLDLIEIPFLHAKPGLYQPENWLLDPKYYWVRVGRMTWDDLVPLADDPTILWTNESSTYHGVNDRVATNQLQQITASLFLLHAYNLRLHVYAPGSDFGNPKRRVQASFLHRAVPYCFWVTDPVVEGQYLGGKDGDFTIGECFVTVSLGEPHDDGYSYKLVAAIIRPEL